MHHLYQTIGHRFFKKWIYETCELTVECDHIAKIWLFSPVFVNNFCTSGNRPENNNTILQCFISSKNLTWLLNTHSSNCNGKMYKRESTSMRETIKNDTDQSANRKLRKKNSSCATMKKKVWFLSIVWMVMELRFRADVKRNTLNTLQKANRK